MKKYLAPKYQECLWREILLSTNLACTEKSHLIWEAILSELYSSPIILVILPQPPWLLSSYTAAHMNSYMAFVAFLYLLAFVLAPCFCKEIHKIPYPMSAQYCLAKWLAESKLDGVMVTTLPWHWIKLPLSHWRPPQPTRENKTQTITRRVTWRARHLVWGGMFMCSIILSICFCLLSGQERGI